MILTHVGKFGDFIPSLIIPNFYYKQSGEKTTFILSSWFKSIVGLDEFLLLQDFTEKVIFDPFLPDNFNLGGQPYKFKPESVNDEKYYNLGIHGFPSKYLGEIYADEYNLSFDKDITLKYVDENFPEEFRGLKVYSHFWDERWDKDRYGDLFISKLSNEGYLPLDPNKSLLHNLNIVHYSSENSFYPNGFSVLLNICKVKHNLVNVSVNSDVYYLNL